MYIVLLVSTISYVFDQISPALLNYHLTIMLISSNKYTNPASWISSNSMLNLVNVPIRQEAGDGQIKLDGSSYAR